MRDFSTVSATLFLSLAAVLARPAAQIKAPEPKQAPPAITLPAEPGIYAVIYTSMGNIICHLFEKDAPKTVANFRGLATGTKAWTDPRTHQVKHTPLYSGTTFQRVIPGFMIQGGDPMGTGEGSPGYTFADEIDPNHNFDQPGVLAMANAGPNTNGCQFFITVAPASHLNGHYSIFGQVVSGQDVADRISEVPRDRNDKPLTPVKILRISIRTVGSAAPKPGTPKRLETDAAISDAPVFPAQPERLSHRPALP
jgi:peptidyl-prolyl cis-trans isomerase A (cyclophilin A)